MDGFSYVCAIKNYKSKKKIQRRFIYRFTKLFIASEADAGAGSEEMSDLITNKKQTAGAIKAAVDQAKKVKEKYIVPPKTTDFAIVYAPTESLFTELTNYQDPSTKELLTQELMKKYKITILGPNTLSAYLQALQMGFQTLRVQKHAMQIHNDLKIISTRFGKHFEGIVGLRKKLEEAMKVTGEFGRDARSILRTLENIKNSDFDDDDPDPDSPTPVSAYGQVSEGKH